MTRHVRIVLLILLAGLLLAALVMPAPNLDPLVFLLVLGWLLVPLAMAWGILDAAYHRDSVWREADQNKVVWVLVQLVSPRGHGGVLHPRSPDAARGRRPGASQLGGVGPRQTQSASRSIPTSTARSVRSSSQSISSSAKVRLSG
jgi:hypothetical protein